MSDLLQFDVAFYPDEEVKIREALNTQVDDSHVVEAISRLDNIIQNGISTTTEDLAFFCMHKDRTDMPQKYATKESIENDVPNFIGNFNRFYSSSSGTLRRPEGAKAMVEYLGVGGALLSVSHVFFENIHEADWEPIPELPGRNGIQTLDFESQYEYGTSTPVASTGKTIIQVEAKGIEETHIKQLNQSTGLSTKVNEIHSKKDAQQNRANNNAIKIGCITSAPREGEKGNATCWLVDPPASVRIADPYFHKLIARSLFYLNALTAISRFSILLALRNRINELMTMTDYQEMDNKQLVKANAEPFHFDSTSFKSKSIAHSNNESIYGFGRVFPIKEGAFFFYGFKPRILNILAAQSFSEINNYREDFSVGECSVGARIDKHYIEGSDEDSAKIAQIPMRGTLTTTNAGRVIGVVVPESH